MSVGDEPLWMTVDRVIDESLQLRAGKYGHVSSLCVLLGFQFALRSSDFKLRRLYSFGKPSDHPTMAPLVGGRISVALSRAYWFGISRVVVPLRASKITAAATRRQPASHQRQNSIYGRLA